MHMSDALVSPLVGGAMWGVSAGCIGLAARSVRLSDDDRQSLPLMGISGAFVFAIQMVNFAVPGTGSSGHLSGGLLLGLLLGPARGLLTMTAVLLIQALLFADGGLLTGGCNIFNIGVIPALGGVALVRVIAGKQQSDLRFQLAVLLTAVLCLELGAFAVVLQTTLSGHAALPFEPFCAAMLGIHLPISLVEGFATLAVFAGLNRLSPDLMPTSIARVNVKPSRRLTALVSLGVMAVGIAGLLSWFSAEAGDGLEWSIARVAGVEEPAPVSASAADLAEQTQHHTALLRDYELRAADSSNSVGELPNIGRTAAGLIGILITLGVIWFCGVVLRRVRRKMGVVPSTE